MALSTAIVLPLPTQITSRTEKREERSPSTRPRFGPIDEMLVVIGDRELEAFAKLFAMSPLKQAMTFEGYLAAKGFARMIPKHAQAR